MEKIGLGVGGMIGVQKPFLPQNLLHKEPASQVKEPRQVGPHPEMEKVLSSPHKRPVLTMITALGVGPLNSLGTVPNRWLYIFKSLWDGDDQEPQSPEESAFQTQRLVAMVSHPSL